MVGRMKKTGYRTKECENRVTGSISRLGTMLVFLVFIAILATGCGSEEAKDAEEPETFEIALITDGSDDSEGTFAGSTWAAVQAFGEEYERTCQRYKVDIGTDSKEKDVEARCNETVDEAIEKGAKVIIFAGSFFETAVHSVQKAHEDVYFVLIDGVPRDKKHKYELAPNSTGVLFAEEEAGFLAGYAAVADGYTKLGFIGGEELPPVKRYGYGFMQGIAAAAKDKGASDVEMKYCYTDTFNAEDWIREGAYEWYSDGTQVIFACGGAIGESVIQATEMGSTDAGASEDGGAAADKKAEGREAPLYKVIGVDTDQSGLSPAVITSAKKEIRTAIFDILKTYIHDNFKGNSIFNYDLKNDGVSLEMANSRFVQFSNPGYGELVEEIKGGKITVQKEMGDKSLKDLASDNISVVISDFRD